MELWETISSESGMKFLAFIGAGIVVAAGAIWKYIQLKQKTISAKNHSSAAGNDININVTYNDKNSSKEP